LVFRGTCACGPILAGSLYQESLSEIFAKKPDWTAAQRLLEESVALDPSPFFVHIELANVYQRIRISKTYPLCTSPSERQQVSKFRRIN
jgi:hypothetical protein